MGRLTPQQRLDELHVNLMNAVTILPAIAKREAFFNSTLNFKKQELAHARAEVDQKVKESVKANELKCNIEVDKKYDEWRVKLEGVREKLRQAEIEKKNLEIDISDRDKKIADQEKRILQLQEEAKMAKAKFSSRENKLMIQGKNAFVISEKANVMLKAFTQKSSPWGSPWHVITW
ncbi:hypothetical protein ACH5RR_013400 [Cinchona calisaya]|uniref:Uncharacterized protein n=1 Tax=Cinchona calisaya TaxID=153742 RepID=A0ABD3A0E6_9GENT